MMKAYCLFEQSGTFKREFKKLGFQAVDCDILNEYGETDVQIDLFKEIEGGYENKPSIFDAIKPDDIVLAFFPCTRFETKIVLFFQGQGAQQKEHTQEQKLEYGMKLHKELHANYMAISKLVIICLRKGLRLIIENPYNHDHYLKRYWSVQPALIDKDRTKNGDYYKKPTQFFFINCEKQENIIFEAMDFVETKNIERASGKNRQMLRSEIHPQYANRFIRQYILTKEQFENINE